MTLPEPTHSGSLKRVMAAGVILAILASEIQFIHQVQGQAGIWPGIAVDLIRFVVLGRKYMVLLLPLSLL